MCKTNCCCKNATFKELVYYKIIFTAIIMILTIVAIFIRAGKTARYEKALIYLDLRNNDTFRILIMKIAEKVVNFLMKNYIVK